MFNIIYIAIGGAIGASLRYLSFYLITHSQFFRAQLFPWPTFFVNIVGSLIAGMLYYYVVKNFDSFNLQFKNFLFFGVLGGFTTFSAFSLDFFRLFQAGQIQMAGIYVVSSVILSLISIFAGFYLMKIILN